MSGLVFVFMLFDGVINLVPLDVVIQTNAELGYRTSPALIRSLGLIGLASALLYAWPKTAVLGAILLTAYMGGAIASQLRIGSPLLGASLRKAATLPGSIAGPGSPRPQRPPTQSERTRNDSSKHLSGFLAVFFGFGEPARPAPEQVMVPEEDSIYPSIWLKSFFR